MIETTPFRKNKICLSDYNYRKDIENRLFMSQLTTIDLDVLEEILYSSLIIPVRKLANNINVGQDEIIPVLQKFCSTGLLTYDEEYVTVDKEMRKYFEPQVLQFDEDFCPGMDFLQNLLRKVPIHILPTWYSIPRTSNNIFDSIIEKYLLTPQTFQRYLAEFSLSDPTLAAVVQDVFDSPTLKITASELIDKHGFSRDEFEECLLLLEFNLVCCLGYSKIGDQWVEVVTPFHEWREYMLFLRSTEASPICETSEIDRSRPCDFSFIQDMTVVLSLAKKHPLSLGKNSNKPLILLSKSSLSAVIAKCEGLKENAPDLSNYIHQIISKLCLLKLADIVDGRLYVLETANDWLDMQPEGRALYLYRHPLNRLLSVSTHLCTDRNIHEAEKSILRVLHTGWIYFDDFIKGVFTVLSPDSAVMLKKIGKIWKYTLPNYSDEGRDLIKATIFEWLFEAGIVATGYHKGRICFSVTPFGQSLFGR
jgi:hypothetical protein